MSAWKARPSAGLERAGVCPPGAVLAGHGGAARARPADPLLDALPAQPAVFADVWLEMPDTNDGKALSAFTRRFAPLLQDALIDQRRLGGRRMARACMCFFRINSAPGWRWATRG